MAVPFDLKLQKLDILRLAVIDHPGSIDQKKLSATIQTDFTRAKDYLGVVQTIGVGYSISVTEELVLVELKLAARFTTSDLEMLWPTEGPESDMALVLRLLTAGITASTARGLLFDRMAGTDLSGWLLPVLDPAEMFEAPKKLESASSSSSTASGGNAVLNS